MRLKKLKKENKRVGFVGIIGRPNVGKSTFLNKVIGEKIAITSDLPQTTRTQILGIKNTDESQIIFIDTPGIHKPRHALGAFLDEQAISSIASVDVILYMVDNIYSKAQDYVIRHFKQTETPVFLVINKIDLLKSKMSIDKIILSYLDTHNFAGVYPISALEGTNFSYLLADIENQLEEMPPIFSEKEVTTASDFSRISELIREKVLYHTKEEIPHAVAVVIDYTEIIAEIYYVYASIIVERASQKNILIGKRGSMLRKIGKEARKDINKVFETKIHLVLWVKVKKGWRQKKHELKGLGYD